MYTRLDCPVCGARASIKFRYLPSINETESWCTVCRSNWVEDGMLTDKDIRNEYNRNVSNDFYSKARKDRPKRN